MSNDEKQPDENENASGIPDRAPTETAPADPNAHAERPAQAQSNGDPARPRRRGFAAMDRERVKQIASKGGRAAHAAGTAHQFSSDEARVAGRKGGMAPHVRRGGVRRRPAPATTEPPKSGHTGAGPSAGHEGGEG